MVNLDHFDARVERYAWSLFKLVSILAALYFGISTLVSKLLYL